MIVSLIVAMTDERVMGKDNALPWHLPEDLKHFKETTVGKPVIMGRKTYDSMGKALPKRRNLVISRNKNFWAAGIEVFESLEAALSACRLSAGEHDEVFIIGGAEIFKMALSLIDRAYVSWVHHSYPGDIYFPEFDFEKGFRVSSSKDLTAANGVKFTVKVYDRLT